MLFRSLLFLWGIFLVLGPSTLSFGLLFTSEIPLVDVMLPQGQPDPDPSHGKAGYLVEYLDIASFFKKTGEDPAAV